MNIEITSESILENLKNIHQQKLLKLQNLDSEIVDLNKKQKDLTNKYVSFKNKLHNMSERNDQIIQQINNIDKIIKKLYKKLKPIQKKLYRKYKMEELFTTDKSQYHSSETIPIQNDIDILCNKLNKLNGESKTIVKYLNDPNTIDMYNNLNNQFITNNQLTKSRLKEINDEQKDIKRELKTINKQIKIWTIYDDNKEILNKFKIDMKYMEQYCNNYDDTTELINIIEHINHLNSLLIIYIEYNKDINLFTDLEDKIKTWTLDEAENIIQTLDDHYKKYFKLELDFHFL